MKTKTQKFKIDPAKEVIAMMVRLARAGIDPGETVPQAVRRLLYSDIGEGSFESHLSKHEE